MAEFRAVTQAILAGGVVAALLDILDAFAFYYAWRGVPPLAILQSIASGLLGQSAYAGGALTAALGLALHLGMATLMAGFYVLCAQRAPVLRHQWLICGLLYGVALYFVMQHVVLPISAVFPRPSFQWPALINGVLGHALLVGLPIAWFARGVSRRPA